MNSRTFGITCFAGPEGVHIARVAHLIKKADEVAAALKSSHASAETVEVPPIDATVQGQCTVLPTRGHVRTLGLTPDEQALAVVDSDRPSELRLFLLATLLEMGGDLAKPVATLKTPTGHAIAAVAFAAAAPPPGSLTAFLLSTEGEVCVAPGDGSPTRPLGIDHVTAIAAHGSTLALGRCTADQEAYLSIARVENLEGPRERIDLAGEGLEPLLSSPSTALQIRSIDFWGPTRLILGLGARDTSTGEDCPDLCPVAVVEWSEASGPAAAEARVFGDTFMDVTQTEGDAVETFAAPPMHSVACLPEWGLATVAHRRVYDSHVVSLEAGGAPAFCLGMDALSPLMLQRTRKKVCQRSLPRSQQTQTVLFKSLPYSKNKKIINNKTLRNRLGRPSPGDPHVGPFDADHPHESGLLQR